MVNTLVTGCAGYVGSHTVRDLFSEDLNVVVLDNLVYGHYPMPEGSCIRDYIHACDLSRAHILALNHIMEENPSANMNPGTGKGVSVFDLINIVEDVTGMRMNYAIAPRREGDPAELVADPARAGRLSC
jgi:UDP-glucose 4-epimerase